MQNTEAMGPETMGNPVRVVLGMLGGLRMLDDDNAPEGTPKGNDGGMNDSSPKQQ